MKFNNIIKYMLAFAFVLTATVISTPAASADCSYNGWLHSGGKCSSSFKNDNLNFQYQTRYNSGYGTNFRYTSNSTSLLLMIERLQEMIRQLERQIEYRERDLNVIITTRTAVDIEDNRATLRGRVYFNDDAEVEVYFEYGESSSDLDEESDHQTIDENDDFTFEEEVDDLDEDTRYYYRAVAEDEDGDKDYGSVFTFRTDSNGNSSNDDLPDVDTDEVQDITDDSAEINGQVDMNDFNNGDVFFVYGEDESQVDDVADDYDKYGDVDEDDEDLQKILVDSDLDDSDDYSRDITNLNNDTRIYYTICVGFEDEDDDPVIKCGDTESFRTGDDSNNDEPELNTNDANDIQDDSARLHGTVDMNDFNNGRVFFVYGEDESQIEDVADDYNEYSDIEEDGDDLQKVSIDSDLDNSASYWLDVNNLDNDTDIYFSICVEYDDEDNDPVIACGDVETFQTD